MNRPNARTTIRLLLAVLLVALPAAADSARTLVERGNDAYGRENYGEALGAYEAAGRERTDSPQIWFNKGDALYQQGDYAKAMEAYEQAAILTKDASLEARSKFNQGNAAFRQGVEQAQSDPSQGLANVEQSVRFFKDALRADPGLGDARHNIEVARRVIEQLRQQQQQQQNQQQNNQGDNQDQQNQQQQQQNEQGDQQEDQQQQNAQGDEQQQDQQDQQQQQAQDQQQAQPPQQAQAAEQAEDILDEERENRRHRQLTPVIGVRPVEKDW